MFGRPHVLGLLIFTCIEDLLIPLKKQFVTEVIIKKYTQKYTENLWDNSCPTARGEVL
jgi:hypothetical protein